ncbi:MAG: SOS response-associated peptidase family protein [Asticcacaulis sp.]
MCGQFEALLYLSMLKNRRAPDDEPTMTRKVVPSLAAPVLVHNPDHGRIEAVEARFGLVPHWYRAALREFKGTTFNAKVETAGEKPAFKGPWRYRRAIVPAVSFAESSGPKTGRQNWRITRADVQPMGFAALWDEASLAGDCISFAILTRPAGPDMAAIHEREPVILDVGRWDDWMMRRPVDLGAYTPLKLINETPVVQPGLF